MILASSSWGWTCPRHWRPPWRWSVDKKGLNTWKWRFVFIKLSKYCRCFISRKNSNFYTKISEFFPTLFSRKNLDRTFVTKIRGNVVDFTVLLLSTSFSRKIKEFFKWKNSNKSSIFFVNSRKFVKFFHGKNFVKTLRIFTWK